MCRYYADTACEPPSPNLSNFQKAQDGPRARMPLFSGRTALPQYPGAPPPQRPNRRGQAATLHVAATPLRPPPPGMSGGAERSGAHLLVHPHWVAPHAASERLA